MKRTLATLLFTAAFAAYSPQLLADDEAIAREIRWLALDLQMSQRRQERIYQNELYWQQRERQHEQQQRRLNRWRDELFDY